MNIDIEQLAAFNKASADPLRLRVLRILAEGSFGVLELCQLFDVKQSGMSHHLKILAGAGLVTMRKEGNSVFYRRAIALKSSTWSNLLHTLFAALDQTELETDTQKNLEGLYQERAQNAQEFFNKHAGDFKEQQDLIASHVQYGETLSELLAQLNLTVSDTALEIGPGEGSFLPALARNFQQVLGIDVSAAMLEEAQRLVTREQLGNVQLTLGSTASAIEQGIQADLITCNMVLHHVPQPKDIFNDSAALLNNQGCLLITDLCAHDQSWARESCGDLWLGFAPEDLTAWANEAGLIETQSQYLGLRNGFQIQFRIFKKSLNNI